MHKDITGETFGRLTAVYRVGTATVGKNQNKLATWYCTCSCGGDIIVKGSSLRTGNTWSCGCAATEAVVNRNTTHGKSHTSEYSIWCRMKKRCSDPNSVDWQLYGARGITVCTRWEDSFEHFLEDMGERPSNKHSIDRINVDLGYSADNCRWATPKQQGRNKRNSRLVDFQGSLITVAEIAEILGKPYQSVLYRINKGIPLYDWIQNTPPSTVPTASVT